MAGMQADTTTAGEPKLLENVVCHSDREADPRLPIEGRQIIKTQNGFFERFSLRELHACDFVFIPCSFLFAIDPLWCRSAKSS